MIIRIKNIANTEDKKRLLSNFFSLSILQAFTYILPLLTLPYLVRVLGVDKFGLVMFAQAFIMFFNILVDYGFNLSATREVSIHREDKDKLTEIFSSVMTIKVILIGVSFGILSIIVFSFEKFSTDWGLYYLTFLWVIGQALFPIWYFQGLERMKYITIVNITSKLIFTIAIFIFIQEESDYILVPILNGLGFIVGGLYSLWLVKKHFNQHFVWQSIQTMIIHLKYGYTIFISTVYTSFYRILPANLLGIFIGNESVAIYTMAEKLIRAIVSLNQPFVNSFFPYISKKFNYDKTQAFSINKKVLQYAIPTLIVLSLILLLLSKFIINLLYGDQSNETLLLFQIFIPLIVITFTANIYGSQTMLHIGLEKEFRNTLKYASIISIFLIPIAISIGGVIGCTITVVMVELFIMSAFIMKANKGLKS